MKKIRVLLNSEIGNRHFTCRQKYTKHYVVTNFSFKIFAHEYGVKIKEGKLYLYIYLMKIVSFMSWCGRI